MTVVGTVLRPSTDPDSTPRLGLSRSYFSALENAGAALLPVSLVQDAERLRALYGFFDALLLPGGADVEPHRYGAPARSDCNLWVMAELDEVELTLARWAIEDGLPVLGICRGSQVLTVACGGTLWQDILVEGVTQTSHYREPGDTLVHAVEVEPGSLLARALGRTRLMVNSLHHQAIREPGALRVVARSPDGLIEGVELESHDFVVGIQCHPEMLYTTEEWAARLFETFVAAARERGGKRVPMASKA